MIIMKYLISSKKNNFSLFNNGNHYRDFTYIDDAVRICNFLIKKNIKKNFDIFNVCSLNLIHLTEVIYELYKYINKPYIIMKPRDKTYVYKTYGNDKKI